jgi:hypothetical protein
VPAIAPPGPYSMRMQAWDQSSAAVMCIDIWFRVVTGPSTAAAAAAAPKQRAAAWLRRAAGAAAAAAAEEGEAGPGRARLWSLLRGPLNWLPQL